jgi:N6-adenosine-specific RNA methylase IME4
MSQLVKYDAACHALAEAKSVDEVKGIRDTAVAWAAYARQAKNRDMEADAIEIRMRATRQLDRLREAQKRTVGLATGGEHGGRKGKDGLRENPSNQRPTLGSQGIDKNLAHQARTLGALSDEQFERVVTDTRDAVSRAIKTVVKASEIEQARETYEERKGQGGKVDDLHALAASGKRFSVIYADPPWEFKVYSGKGKQRSADRHYDTAGLDDIASLPIEALAAPDCALFLWAVMPELPGAIDVLRAWGFEYKTVGFTWAKQNRSGEGWFTGMGYWTRANAELCLLATRGSPQRLAMDVQQLIVAPVREHSRKPDEAPPRIERLLAGPYLELFARAERPGWTTWGNEIARREYLEAAE